MTISLPQSSRKVGALYFGQSLMRVLRVYDYEHGMHVQTGFFLIKQGQAKNLN